uniref:Uncharacterized protein n=1 Tax=Triticum urartu TaxID=4572 RepID=A0A8R7UF96_TRIUA
MLPCTPMRFTPIILTPDQCPSGLKSL